MLGVAVALRSASRAVGTERRLTNREGRVLATVRVLTTAWPPSLELAHAMRREIKENPMEISLEGWDMQAGAAAE